jgi:hypothetical protein
MLLTEWATGSALVAIDDNQGATQRKASIVAYDSKTGGVVRRARAFATVFVSNS